MLCTLCPVLLEAAKTLLARGTPTWLDADHLQTIHSTKAGTEDDQVVLGLFLGNPFTENL